MNTEFSVLMSVYRNDNPEHFVQAVESIGHSQDLQPTEILLVVDGPVEEQLRTAIEHCEDVNDNLNVVWLPKNVGLGNALREGLLHTHCEIVARMDSDDVANPSRFKQQIAYLLNNPTISIVGGQISEFIDSLENTVGNRVVPLDDMELKSYSKARCPFNHMTLKFRKQDVLAAGNYMHWHFNEDYYLWIRMAEAGYKFANLPDVLVNVRVGKDMYARRGGWKYFKSEKGLQDYMLQHNMISLPRYIYNTLGRFVVQVAMPNRLRGFIFQKLFRK